MNRRRYFTFDDNNPNPLGYLLSETGYKGLDHFTFRRIDNREIPNADSNPMLRAFNRLHAGYRIAVEWDIGGLKSKFGRIIRTCPNRCRTFAVLFDSAAILTNFIHRSRMQLTHFDEITRM